MGTTMTVREIEMELPENKCSECEMTFSLCWNRNPLYTEPQYCPFCGEKIEEFVRQDEDE